VTVYDVGRAELLSYIAMELVKGRTLRELLVAGPLPPKRAVAIAAPGVGRACEGALGRDRPPGFGAREPDGLA
jgi:hypothetical protein